MEGGLGEWYKCTTVCPYRYHILEFGDKGLFLTAVEIDQCVHFIVN